MNCKEIVCEDCIHLSLDKVQAVDVVALARVVLNLEVSSNAGRYLVS
jgi:hypothetical protein